MEFIVSIRVGKEVDWSDFEPGCWCQTGQLVWVSHTLLIWTTALPLVWCEFHVLLHLFSSLKFKFFFLSLLFLGSLLCRPGPVLYPHFGRCVLYITLRPLGRIVAVGILCAVQIKLIELDSVLRSAAACLALLVFWTASCVFLRIDLSYLKLKVKAFHKACKVLSGHGEDCPVLTRVVQSQASSV